MHINFITSTHTCVSALIHTHLPLEYLLKVLHILHTDLLPKDYWLG